MLRPALALPLCLLALPAQAEMKVKVGGYTAFQAAAFDNDNTNSSNRDFLSESEIFIRASDEADNGLRYGVKVELQTSTSDSANADEAAIFLESAFGRLELGDDDGPTDMSVSTPRVGIGQVNGSIDDFIPAADRGHLVNNRGSAGFLPYDSDDATKISYTTPRYHGWQVGLSYAPEAQSGSDGETVVFLDTDRVARNFFEFGLRWQGDIGPVNLMTSFEYNTASTESATREGVNAWGFGAQLKYEQFRVGGGYSRDGDTLGLQAASNDEVYSWNLGGTYESGDWGFGLSYLRVDFDQNGGGQPGIAGDGTGGSFGLIAAGVAYKIADGLSAGADLGFYDRNRATGTDTNGWVLVTDVTAAF